MFQKVLETFKVKCRDKKFIVRDFQYNEQALLKESEQLRLLEQNKKDKFVRSLSLFFQNLKIKLKIGSTCQMVKN